MKYIEEETGKWIFPTRKGYKLACCDCGLVHRLDFRIREKHIEFRMFRDNPATGQMRRRLKKE